ncbi:MAG: RagB/SusD family nutrient uptake outer membrane protein, partial [Prevotella sp.]
YTQLKCAPYMGTVGNSTNANDIPLIRIEEMYYILAEAQAMGGNPSQGNQTLVNFVRTYRDPSFNSTASTAAAVQEAVFQQRRVEFWGEGITWFDYIRLNKDFDRRGGGFETNTCFDIHAGDNALIWRIPYNEIQYNAKISESDNNPVPTHPTPVQDEE